jgi:hypothetical protein
LAPFKKCIQILSIISEIRRELKKHNAEFAGIRNGINRLFEPLSQFGDRILVLQIYGSSRPVFLRKLRQNIRRKSSRVDAMAS